MNPHHDLPPERDELLVIDVIVVSAIGLLVLVSLLWV